MTWKNPLIPRNTVNPYTGKRPTWADVQHRLAVLRTFTQDYTLAVSNDGTGAYVLTTRKDMGHRGTRELANLGKSIPAAHKALHVMCETLLALDMHTR